MSHSSDDFVAVIAILVVFGLPLAYAMANRWYSHQERLEMIKRGAVPPPDPNWSKRMRKEGWFDPSACGMPGAFAGYPYGYDPNRQLRRGITLVCLGIGLTVGLSFIRPGTPGPWLLGGLIPLFIGVAQVVVAMLSGAAIAMSGSGPWQGRVPPGDQTQAPGQQQPFTGPRDVTPGGYGGWRPGPTTGLEKPPSPPDVR